MNKILGGIAAVTFSGAVMQSAAQTKVIIDTNFGEIPVVLFDAEAPNTVDNFLSYIERGDYTSTIFHRAMTNFVLQSGGFQVAPSGPYLLEEVTEQDSIQNEYGRSNTKGTLAMAKLSGNAHSATSQWFINLADNSGNLDNQNGGFTVFGEVESFTVIDAIMAQNIINIGGVFGDLPVRTARDDGSAGPQTAADLVADDFIKINSVKVEKIASIPEPSSACLLLIGSGALLLRRRR